MPAINLIIQIGFPFCIMAYFDNKEKLSHDKNDKEILNNSLLVSILLPICVLIIQPVNFVLHFIYTRLWLNHKCYKNLLIISGCYTIFICLILLITNTILVYQYIFFFLIILLYLIPFAVGVLYLFYKYLKYHADQINIDNFSYERIRILGSTDNRHRYLIDRQERRNRRNIGNEITNHETNHEINHNESNNETNYESNYEFNTRSSRMLGLRNNRNSIELLSPDDTGITFNGENDNDLFITHTSNSSNSSNNSNNSDNSNQVFYLVNSTVEREINPDELNETYRDNGFTDSSNYLEDHENSYA
jgi:hypothetical protein